MNAQIVTYVVYFFIIGIFIYGLTLLVFKKKIGKETELLPSLSVSFGILGTFIGIFLGLREFAVENISDSVPKLLEGLKTAFATSIAGMSISIVLKVMFEIKASFSRNENEVVQEDPIELFKEMVSGIKSLDKSSREIEQSIVSCFRSNEEYSLISQLKLIRQEVTDSKNEVCKQFEEFAKKMAESNTDALVEALEKVIGDFNTLLNDLVSESFKELSSAMIKLTEWQENYKKHVDETQQKINDILEQMDINNTVMTISSESIDRVDSNLKGINSSIKSLSVSSEDIQHHIENLKHQNQALKESIEAVKNIGEEAKTVIPTFTSSINQLTNELKDTVNQVSTNFETSSSQITDFVERNTKEIKSAVEAHNTTVKNSIKDIDEGLEEELTKALNTLAGSMASLSAKFVEDYQPLTDRLREIVRLAEKADA
jgi:chromosome segregation ATPase